MTQAARSTEASDALTRALHVELDALYRFVRRMGLTEADTEDALQEVALVCSTMNHEMSVHSPRGYLFGIAYKIASRLRQRARSAGPDVADLQIRDSAATPEEALERQQARRLLDAILDTLPDGERAVFLLCDVEEHTMAEVAEHLDIPPGTVASRLRRARETFTASRARLERSMRS